MKYFIILLSILIFSCSDQSNTKTETPHKDEIIKGTVEEVTQPDVEKDTVFQAFYESLPELDLPVKINCGWQTALDETEFIPKFKALIPRGFKCVGKLKSDQIKGIFYAAVGDIIYPYLYTYEENGTPIDSINLHNGYCSSDPHYNETSTTIIDDRLEFTMIVKTEHFSYSENEKGYTRRLDSIEYKISVITIEESGMSKLKYDSVSMVKNEKFQIIEPNTVTLIYPTDEQIEMMDEEVYYTVADDNNYYTSILIDLLDSLKISQPVAEADYLLFKGTEEDYIIYRSDTFWDAYLFDGKTGPIKLDIVEPDLDEIKSVTR